MRVFLWGSGTNLGMEQLTICVPGTLAIQSNAGNAQFFQQHCYAPRCEAAATYAPAGAAVVLKWFRVFASNDAIYFDNIG